jgi:hypothetical protein
LVPEATVDVRTGDGRIRPVVIMTCDDGSFPISDLPGRSFSAVLFGSAVIGVTIDGQTCRDSARYRQSYTASHEAAPTYIAWSLIGLLTSVLGLRFVFSRILPG